MCGIGGIVANRIEMVQLQDHLSTMCAVLRRRGPDGEGSWIAPTAHGDWRVGLAHTRLAIQDLSDLGAQPMTSPSKSWAISFNGEIYNFQALRADLDAQGARFSGHSDTEVLAAALDVWGLEQTLRRIDGMFALAAYDQTNGRLYLARDRSGEKPLYFGRVRGHFVFASTVRPLEALSMWEGKISPHAVALFLRYRYIPAPHCIYSDLQKLPPGHIACLNLDTPGVDPTIHPYWVLDPCKAGRAKETMHDTVDALDKVLGQVVSEQLVSDRSLGAFLSGGIDSSLVTAMMCEQSTQPIKTFTVAFEEPEYNEADDARQVAEFLGTDHTEVILPVTSGLDLIPELHQIYDEPFADASQLPTLMVARAARQEVVVALSGDGGDESFAGYGRYLQGLSDWHRLQRWPGPVRGGLSRLARSMTHGPLEHGATSLMRLFRRGRGRRAGNVFHRWAQEFASTDILDMYHYSLVLGRGLTPTMPINDAWLDTGRVPRLDSDLRRMMAFDFGTYLPDDVLVKVDRATMHYGLESRAPLLDRRIVEFAWRLPDHQLRNDERGGKLLLRHLLDKKVPRALTDRPKSGFAAPVRDWLRREMRDWAESLLSPASLAKTGLLDGDTIRHRWQQHLDGVWDNSSLIWTVLQLQAWMERPS